MPLPVAHGLLGASIVAALHPRPRTRSYRSPLLIGALLANAADLDFLLVFALRSKAWHRGFTHSLAFALLIFLTLILSFGRRRLREAVAYGAAFASHAALDYATTRKGGGLALLWPVSTERLMLGWCGLSEVPSKLTPLEILQAVSVELLLFAPLFLAVCWLRNRAARRGAGSEEGAF